MSGHHGSLAITGQKFASPVVIAPAPGEVAHVDSITIRNSQNFVIQGLKVWARSLNAGTGALVRSYSDTSDIAITDLDIRAVDSSGNYLQWSKTDWGTYKRDGMLIDGNRVTVARNRVTGIFHGIFMYAANALMEENIVDGFAGDALRALGDNSIVRRNKAQNCFQIDGNHADGFQAFTMGPSGPGTGTIHNLTLEDNKIFEWTASTTSPFKCLLQGIGMYDGMYDGLVIRNNVIAVSAYHGIAVAGALNAKIVNNTVVHQNGAAVSYPWIMVSPHRDGTPSGNVTVANNLTNKLLVTSNPSQNILETSNVIVTNTTAEFTALSNQDFSLKSTSKAVNAANPSHAPADDIAGTARPLGTAPDAGAYESF